MGISYNTHREAGRKARDQNGGIVSDALGARVVGGDFVFSTNGRSPVSGWSRAKAKLDAFLGAGRAMRGEGPFDPWRFHDLRRSFATHACDVLHVDPVVADRCLNHVGASTTSTVSRIYARNELFDQRRDALTRWAALFEQRITLSAQLSDDSPPDGTPVAKAD